MGKAPIVTSPELTVGELLPRMREMMVRVVPVIDDMRLVGVVSYKGILLSGAGSMTKVRTIMEPPYSLRASDPLDEAIAKFVLWKAKAIPVVNDSRMLVGYLSREALLRYLLDMDLLPSRSVGEIMTSPATVIRCGESVARARWLMLRGGISRLPVVGDRSETIEGVISMTDIVERLYTIRLTRRRGFEQFEEEFLAAPVREFMTSPPITSTTGEPVVKAVDRMLEYRITGMPVVDGDRVVGVVSGIDVLRGYAESLVRKELVEAKLSSSLSSDRLLRTQAETLLNEYLSDIRRVTNILNFKISVKEESKGGRRRYVVRARMSTDHRVMTAEGSGWDLLSAIRDALSTLESRVKKYKRMTRELRRKERSEE